MCVQSPRCSDGLASGMHCDFAGNRVLEPLGVFKNVVQLAFVITLVKRQTVTYESVFLSLKLIFPVRIHKITEKSHGA